jgi:hypothetical protein
MMLKKRITLNRFRQQYVSIRNCASIKFSVQKAEMSSNKIASTLSDNNYCMGNALTKVSVINEIYRLSSVRFSEKLEDIRD